MAVVDENETTQAATAPACDNGNARPPPAAKLLDPQLLMAARRGDSELLKELLLQQNKDEVHAHGHDTVESAAAAAVASEVVIVEVVPRRPSPAPAPAASPPYSSSGSGSAPPPLVDGLTSEGDSLLHVVATCGDGEDFLHCAKMIAHVYGHKGGAAAVRLALQARNRKGDTPLHCAAAAGNADMIFCLVDLMANANEATAAAVKALVRTQNRCGETALHQAVRAAKNKEACIDQLVNVDPELACIPFPHQEEEDDAGASPLYLAISLGEVEIARHLYIKSKGKMSYSGPYGRNVLHAAVHRGQALPMILEWLKDTKPEEYSSSVALVSQLTGQRDKKQKGSTPLHLAASLNGWPSAWFLSRRFPRVWPTGESMAKLLLDANESTAYQADDQGSYPIHVAAASKSLGVVKMLVERCPDCATLRDGNGRTFLHVAAMEESPFPWTLNRGVNRGEGTSLHVVQYVCGEMSQQLSWMILNAQDSNGNTALHGAVRAGNLDVFNCLLRNRQVRLDLANKDGMTPLDLSWTMLPAGFYYGFNPRGIVCSSLIAAGAPHRGGRSELFTEKHIRPKRDVDKEAKNYTEATQVLSIVTALIATVTFASAFTLPGGYRSADDAAGAAGTPVLAGSYAFDAFILADTLAFLCSIGATCTLVYAGLPALDISQRNWYFIVSASALQSAARSLVAAFGLGLYLVFHRTASAIAACAIVFASSLYGNVAAWQFIRMAKTVVARIGIQQYAVVGCVISILFQLSVHFGSYVIIFGLPAISKWVIPAIHKWFDQKKL